MLKPLWKLGINIFFFLALASEPVDQGKFPGLKII